MQVRGMICSVLGRTMETPGVEVYRPAVCIMDQRGYGPPPWILINTVGYRKSPKYKNFFWWLKFFNRTAFKNSRLEIFASIRANFFRDRAKTGS